jgi:hypothetical protein
MAARDLTNVCAECTYDQPSNRRRNPAPQYIEALEARLQRAEALLQTVLPGVDLDDPKLENLIPQKVSFPGEPNARVLKRENVPRSRIPPAMGAGGKEGEKDSLLESMVQSTATLDLDDQGYWDYRGHSSGVLFLRRMRQQFGDMMGSVEGHGVLAKPKGQKLLPLGVFDSPRSTGDSPLTTSLPPLDDLPSKDCGRELCEVALDDACALMRFVHQPTFYAMFDRVYDTEPELFEIEENKYLPLVYSIMAVGCLFSKNENSKLQTEGYENAIDQG